MEVPGNGGIFLYVLLLFYVYFRSGREKNVCGYVYLWEISFFLKEQGRGKMGVYVSNRGRGRLRKVKNVKNTKYVYF